MPSITTIIVTSLIYYRWRGVIFVTVNIVFSPNFWSVIIYLNTRLVAQIHAGRQSCAIYPAMPVLIDIAATASIIINISRWVIIKTLTWFAIPVRITRFHIAAGAGSHHEYDDADA
jgi:hypothetical protein